MLIALDLEFANSITVAESLRLSNLFDEKEVANATGAQSETIDAILCVAREAERAQNARRAEAITKSWRQLCRRKLLAGDDQIAILQRYAIGRINFFAVICAFVFS